MRLANVNTRDIRAAVDLGCRTMCSVFNADDRDVPFFGSTVRPVAGLHWSDVHSESHVPGRHLNALLSAEAALGLEVPPDAIAKHAAAARFSYGGPLALPLNRARIDGPLELFNDHNLREGFHALYALARFRGDEQALELARRSIGTIRELWDPRRGWDDKLSAAGVRRQAWQDHFIVGIARSIGPLVKLHRCGCGEALDLAMVLKEKATAEHFAADGGYDRAAFGDHTHSTTCTMSGLALMAEALGDAALMERVRRFYENGLWRIRDAVGWVIENVGREGLDSDVGESNNTGDILETALILARNGHPECYDDAELILRAHLLPSQLRDVSFIIDPPNPQGEDGKRDVADRHLGAFGFPAPYGHQPAGVSTVSFNMDIVGGAVGSLVEAWRQVVTVDEGAIRVNMLFDHESDAAAVESPYATGGVLRVTPLRTAPLAIRVPGWADPAAWEVSPRDADVRFTAGWLRTGPVAAGRTVEVRLPLAKRSLVLRHLTHDIRVELHGDEPVAMDSFGADLTFFDEMRQGICVQGIGAAGTRV